MTPYDRTRIPEEIEKLRADTDEEIDKF